MTSYLLPFEKMHGLGNDFIMLEKRHLPNGVDHNLLSKYLCDRHYAIGADGIIIVDISNTKDADFAWEYYNSDGSEAQMCGNGMRCFAKYVFERGFTEESSFKVLTKAGIIKPTLEEDGTVTVNMGSPQIPKLLNEEININSKKFKFTCIQIGNPHCVIFLDNYIDDDNFYKYGPLLEKHKRFPNFTNVEFANVISKNEIKCRVWERGSGATLACGTGACAILIAANLNNYTDSKANVRLPGGVMKIWWDKNENNVYLNGQAEFTYIGHYNLDPIKVSKK